MLVSQDKHNGFQVLSYIVWATVCPDVWSRTIWVVPGCNVKNKNEKIMVATDIWMICNDFCSYDWICKTWILRDNSDNIIPEIAHLGLPGTIWSLPESHCRLRFGLLLSQLSTQELWS